MTAARMFMICIAIASFGCVARPSVRWEQVGKTHEEAQSDYRDCRRGALQAEADLRSKAESTIEEGATLCLEEKGYYRNTWERFVCCRRLLES